MNQYVSGGLTPANVRGDEFAFIGLLRLTLDFQLNIHSYQSNLSTASSGATPELDDYPVLAYPLDDLFEETKFDEIRYEHEGAIREAKKMLAALSTLFESMELGMLRRDSWEYDMNRYLFIDHRPSLKVQVTEICTAVFATLPCPV